MSISDKKLDFMRAITAFEGKIEKMHLDFQKYCNGEIYRMPDWQRLETDLIVFSRKKIFELVMQKNLDRVLYKFQNRKKIWLKWVDDFRMRPNEETED